MVRGRGSGGAGKPELLSGKATLFQVNLTRGLKEVFKRGSYFHLDKCVPGKSMRETAKKRVLQEGCKPRRESEGTKSKRYWGASSCGA